MNPAQDNWRRACSHVNGLRVCAGLGILIGLVFLLLLPAYYRHHAVTGDLNPSKLIWVAVFFLVIGTGLLFDLKIFAVIFSLVVGGMGLWLAGRSLMLVPDNPLMLISTALGLCLLLPSWFIIAGWAALR